MSIAPYPGVQVVEVPSGVRTITGVATSITAFIGRAPRGPVNTATRVQSFAEYSRNFGGLSALSPMSYAVQHFFQHGGRDALIVRIFNAGAATNTVATITLPTDTAGEDLVLEAASAGAWGAALSVSVDYVTSPPPVPNTAFNLTIEVLDRAQATRTVLGTERLRNLSTDPANARFYPVTIMQSSSLVRVRTAAPNQRRPASTFNAANVNTPIDATGGGDGSAVGDTDIIPNALATGEIPRTGLFALDAVDLFNILCIPPLDWAVEVGDTTWARTAEYCADRRAILIVDPPASWTSDPNRAVSTAEGSAAGMPHIHTNLGAFAANGAVYFPRLRMADPLAGGAIEDFVSCGAVAGLMARNDALRGVWKAPAGLEAAFSGVSGFTYALNDDENGRLNPLGLNCLRHFDAGGNVIWGARTAAGSDALASEWKYLPVRRMALFLEESLYRGTQWVVFEPNDAPLWAQIRLNVGSFMHQLFRKGAFQGSSPKDAYFVKCDAETTTQADIDQGIVNILVGFAPLKPAEFVILQIQQIAGEIET